MGQFQCELQVSSFTKLFSLIINILLAIMVLFAPWPNSLIPFHLIIIILLAFGCILNWKKIRSYQGKIIFRAEHRIHWGGQDWVVIKNLWTFSRYGLLLVLEQEDTNLQKSLWLLYDNMTESQWRQLRQFTFLLNARLSTLN